MNFHHCNKWLLKNLQCFPTARMVPILQSGFQGCPQSRSSYSKPLLPKKQPSLNGFFRIQEHILLLIVSPLSWSISSKKMRIILLFASTYSSQPNPSQPPLPHNSFSLCHSLNHTLTFLLFQHHSAGLNSVPCRAAAGPFIPRGCLECHPYAFAYRDDYFISMCFCWQQSDASHIQLNVRYASYSALTRGVNSETHVRLSFVWKCLHSENRRLQIRSINQQSWTLLKLAKTLFKLVLKEENPNSFVRPLKSKSPKSSLINQ